MGRRLRLHSAIAGLLFSLGCFALVLRQVDLRESWNALGRLNGPFILIPVAILFLNLPLRAWRWQLIFPASSRPAFASCLTVLGIGNMANFLLPGRAGDLARCLLLNESTTIHDSSRILATLAVEKLLDGFALIGMILLAVWFLHPPSWVFALLRIATLIFGGAMILIAILRYQTRRLIDYLRSGFRRVRLSAVEATFDGALTSFADGLAAIGSLSQILSLLLLTAMIWSVEATLIWGLARSLGLAISIKSTVVASAVLGLGLMIPAAPGGLGTYELLGTEAFKLTGIAASVGLAVTLGVHAWVFASNIAVGICLLAVKGGSLAQLRHRLAVNADPESPAQPSSNPATW